MDESPPSIEASVNLSLLSLLLYILLKAIFENLRKLSTSFGAGTTKQALKEKIIVRLLCLDSPVNLVWTCHFHNLDAIYKITSIILKPKGFLEI